MHFSLRSMPKQKIRRGPDTLKLAAQVAHHGHRFRDHVFAILMRQTTLLSVHRMFLGEPGERFFRPGFVSGSFRRFLMPPCIPTVSSARSKEKSRLQGVRAAFFNRDQTYTLVSCNRFIRSKKMLEEITTTFAWMIPIAICSQAEAATFLLGKASLLLWR